MDGLDVIEQELEVLPPANAWWLPPRNLVLNQLAEDQYNLWRFTILPPHAQYRGYQEETNGILTRPAWVPLEKTVGAIDEELADKLLVVFQKSETVQETVRKELDWLEATFQIRIPQAIEADLLRRILDIARRCWGVDPVRIFVPLDGSQPMPFRGDL